MISWPVNGGCMIYNHPTMIGLIVSGLPNPLSRGPALSHPSWSPCSTTVGLPSVPWKADSFHILETTVGVLFVKIKIVYKMSMEIPVTNDEMFLFNFMAHLLSALSCFVISEHKYIDTEPDSSHWLMRWVSDRVVIKVWKNRLGT